MTNLMGRSNIDATFISRSMSVTVIKALSFESELTRTFSSAAAADTQPGIEVALTNYQANNGLSENTKKGRQLSSHDELVITANKNGITLMAELQVINVDLEALR